MHYYIDGYNLMFRVLKVGENLRSERQQMVEELYEMIDFLNLDTTIVFDAHSSFGVSSRVRYHSISICYTDENETADDYIINELSSCTNPRIQVVVTSDTELGRRARRLHAKTEKVEYFYAWLLHRYHLKKKDTGKKLSQPKVLVHLKNDENDNRHDADVDSGVDSKTETEAVGRPETGDENWTETGDENWTESEIDTKIDSDKEKKNKVGRRSTSSEASTSRSTSTSTSPPTDIQKEPIPYGTAEENIEYYLYHFEKEYNEIEKSGLKKVKLPPPRLETDYERWLRIFEAEGKGEGQGQGEDKSDNH